MNEDLRSLPVEQIEKMISAKMDELFILRRELDRRRDEKKPTVRVDFGSEYITK